MFKAIFIQEHVAIKNRLRIHKRETDWECIGSFFINKIDQIMLYLK